MKHVAGPASEPEEGLIASCISVQSYDSVMPREDQNVGTGICDVLSHVSTIQESLERPFRYWSCYILREMALQPKNVAVAVTFPQRGNEWPILLPAASHWCWQLWGSSCEQTKEEDLGSPKALVQPEHSQHRAISDSCGLLPWILKEKWFLTSKKGLTQKLKSFA